MFHPVRRWCFYGPIEQTLIPGSSLHDVESTLADQQDIDSILRAHRVPYQATATVAYPEDMARKFAKARAVSGFRFIHILSPCPPGWKHDADQTVRYSRLAVQTGLFPLYELEEGRFKLSVPVPRRKPVEEFLAGQGRFKNLRDEDKAALQRGIDERWERLAQGRID